VLSGYSAAELLGARCAPAETNAELTIPGGDLREQPGLTVHRDVLADDEVSDVTGVLATTALRTAWGLARWLPAVEAVVAMDSLAKGAGSPRIQNRYPRARWRRPPLKLAMEYDGRGHLAAWQHGSAARRLNLLGTAG
jgi:hypothetical protein